MVIAKLSNNYCAVDKGYTEIVDQLLSQPGIDVNCISISDKNHLYHSNLTIQLG